MKPMNVGNHKVSPTGESVSIKDKDRPSNPYSPYIDINEDWEKKKTPNDTRENKSD